MDTLDRVLADNLATVRQRIGEAARRGGRDADEVELVAVTKYVDAQVARRLTAAGCLTLGESRPQALWQKAEALQDLPIRWHMIGHLQRNKIRRTLPWLVCIHSADSVRLLNALNDEAGRTTHDVRVLLEVNVAEDAEKTGFLPADLIPLAAELTRWDHLHICGLMAMSGRSSDAGQARSEFVQVRQLRDRLQQECSAGIALRHLSMGMSQDYEIAVEEGATVVRVGSALFEGVLK